MIIVSLKGQACLFLPILTTGKNPEDLKEMQRLQALPERRI